MEPPTQTYQQSETLDPLASSSPDDLISSGRTDSLLDPAFNTGLANEPAGRFEPTRPGGEFSEFEGVTPKLSPIIPDPASSTVEVAGPSLKVHMVQKGDSLWSISRRYNVSLEDLYAANGLNKNSILKIDQRIQIPVEGGTATISTITADTYQPSGYNMDAETYTVVRGDTLSKIARQFNTTVRMIKTANGKNTDVIRVGEKLTIPVNSRNSVGSRPIASGTNNNASSSAPGGFEIHITKAGEYPATIARKYGMTTVELLAINGITDPRSIQVGQRLKVNRKSGTASTEKLTVQPAPVITPKAPVVIQPPQSTSVNAPVEIQVIEADPLIESEIQEINPDSMFEDAKEMPVVPLD